MELFIFTYAMVDFFENNFSFKQLINNQNGLSPWLLRGSKFNSCNCQNLFYSQKSLAKWNITDLSIFFN